MKVFFWHANKHQNFLQAYFNTLSVKVSYKLILSLLMSMIMDSQSTQINKFAMSLQYLKFTRHVQKFPNRNLEIFLQYLKKKVLQLLLCSILLRSIQVS